MQYTLLFSTRFKLYSVYVSLKLYKYYRFIYIKYSCVLHMKCYGGQSFLVALYGFCIAYVMTMFYSV